MTAKHTIDPIAWMINHLTADNSDPVRDMLKHMAELLMSAEVEAMCNAGYGEVSDQRVNKRNGYRPRQWDTRVGTIELGIPKLRKGSYFPDWLLQPRRRSEQALWTAIATAYLAGVSTRRVDKLAKALGIDGISKSQVSRIAAELDGKVQAFRERKLERPTPYVWLDAVAIKVREQGRVVSVAVVIAIGARDDGQREVLGVDVITAEDHGGWDRFLHDLTKRGLRGVKLVISDAHQGLKAAIDNRLIGTGWQRCRTHFGRNLLSRVPKRAQSFVASAVRTIYDQHDAEAVEAQAKVVLATLYDRFPAAAEMLDEAREEILAFRHFPKTHWRQIWSNNPLERLNKEVRRRTNVVGIFPNRDALMRLVGALLAEQNDEWVEGRRYMSLDSMKAILATPATVAGGELADEATAAFDAAA